MSVEDERLSKHSSYRCGELNDEQLRILRDHGTERAGTSELNHETRAGRYVCVGCGHFLFKSDAKYDSGSGWPSFWYSERDAIGTEEDTRFGMYRVEVHCACCRGHLGHLFPDGPPPTGKRYCINGLALDFLLDSSSIETNNNAE